MTILEQLAETAKARVAEAKSHISLKEMQQRAQAHPTPQDFPFRQGLQQKGMSFICEVKKASPSKGVIAADFPYLEIARDYAAAGAAAISVLTEPSRFLGSDQYLQEISDAVQTPTLRKDFLVDAYQIYEAKTLGASAILLICAILSDAQLSSYLELAHSLGLDALVEAHDATEVHRALQAGADIIGVNNRDLHTFEVDIHTSERLRDLVPPAILFVSESGIRTPEDIARLSACGVDAVLIGETFMRSPDKKAALDALRGAACS